MNSEMSIKSWLGRALAWMFSVLILIGGLSHGRTTAAWAGPVDWHEVAANQDGRQWWDAGSLRVNRNGNLTVLSRFQPAAPADQPRNADGSEPRPPASDLYVMEIDCGQTLYRDTSINGIPQWGSSWQAAAADDLISSTINEACAAGESLLAGF
ncbi:MAG: hypothetical protein ACO3GW_05080 [Vulcanococcus sp.]|jgi:hypothetical protein